MKKNRGSITLFMSIVYLTLVAFALGLVEAYRLQYLYAKQEILGRLALHNIKADYIAGIMEEYGLLFYHEALADGEDTLKKTNQIFFEDQAAGSYFQDFLAGQEQGDYYHFPYFRVENSVLEKEKREMGYQDLMDARAEAILFARDKLPFTMAQPWLEKLQIWQKSRKAEEWLKKKEVILKKFQEGDQRIRRLYRYLDGVEIEAGTQAARIVGIGVNSFNAQERSEERKKSEINTRGDLPQGLKEEMLQGQYNATAIVKEIEGFVADGMGIVDEYLPFAPELEIAERYMLQAEMNQALSEHKRKMKARLQPFYELTDAYRNAERLAEEIADVHTRQIPEMKQFLTELEQADISPTVKGALRHEIEQLLWQCDADNSMSRIGNFKYLREKLREEKENFLNILQGIQSFYQKGEGILADYERALSSEREWPEERMRKWLEAGEALLLVEGYFYFPLSYHGYKENEAGESSESLESKQNEIKGQAERQLAEFLILDREKIVNADRLPSALAGEVPVGSISISDEHLQQAEKAWKELTEDFIVNEYYFMVFSHFALQPEDELAISGYAKSDHARKGELEYLLFGGAEEAANQGAMIGALFGIRLLFNVLALISDAAKMATVNSLAAAIAGWWSLGAGAAVVAGAIVALWSALETGADIFMLFRGQRVPLIKTPATWYTSLQGALSGLAMEGVDALADAAEKGLTEGIEAVQDNLNEAGASLTGELRYYLENRTAERAEELRAEVKKLDLLIRRNVEDAVRAKLQGYPIAKEKAEQELVQLGLSQEQAKNLIEKAFQSLEGKAAEWIEENYTKRIEAAEQAIQSAQAEIEKVLREAEEKGLTAMREKLKELAEEFSRLGKEEIKKQKEALKRKIDQKWKSVAKEENADSPKTWRDYLGMNYADYLRLFLLLDFVPDQVKWLRALDLIQQNQQQSIPDFYLMDCERSFEIRSEATYQPSFYPFGRRGLFGEWLENKYRIEVYAEGGY